MNMLTVSVLAIVGERLVVVTSGLVSILVGWRLFARAVVPPQNGTIELGDWKVELKNVGPGIFFSLFGTIILVYVLVKPAVFDIKHVDGSEFVAPEEKRSVTEAHLSGLSNANSSSWRPYILAANTIFGLNQKIEAELGSGKSFASITPPEANDLSKATKLLMDFRRQILVSTIGVNAIDEWMQNETTYRSAPQKLSVELRDRLGKVAPLFVDKVNSNAP